MKLPLFIFFVLCFSTMFAQDSEKVFETFKDRRVINAHSVETLQKRQLDVRIGHRFGDLAGDAGGWPTFYGLESAADVLIGVEYGVTNNLTAGLFRTKGAGDLKQLINGQLKYRLLQQKKNGTPVTLSLLGISAISTMKKTDDPDLINHFDKTAHRMIFGGQILLARKFSDRFSLQITPSFIHRNIVPFDDENNLLSVGLASRIQLTKVIGFLLDLTYPISEFRNDNDIPIPLSFGFEFDTGGHVFQLNFTNATGLSAVDYIPYTTSKWGEGQFRMGFTISRLFNL